MAFEIKCRGSCRSSRGRSGHHLVCRSGGEPPGPWRERACGDPRRVHPRPGGVAAQRRLRVGRTSALHPRARGVDCGTGISGRRCSVHPRARVVFVDGPVTLHDAGASPDPAPLLYCLLAYRSRCCPRSFRCSVAVVLPRRICRHRCSRCCCPGCLSLRSRSPSNAPCRRPRRCRGPPCSISCGPLFGSVAAFGGDPCVCRGFRCR